MVFLLAGLLALAAVWDIRRRRIPNWLTLAGLALGLLCQTWQNGVPGLWHALAGLGVAGLALPLYAVRGLGAGDVKLLGAVGALMGPLFLLWTLLGTLLAGGLLALVWAASKRALWGTVMNALFGLHLLRAGAGLESIATHSRAGKMPMAPAIALGAVAAYVRLHGGLSR